MDRDAIATLQLGLATFLVSFGYSRTISVNRNKFKQFSSLARWLSVMLLFEVEWHVCWISRMLWLLKPTAQLLVAKASCMKAGGLRDHNA